MFKERSGVVLSIGGKKYELTCNYRNMDELIKYLDAGVSFWLQPEVYEYSNDDEETFSIEKAVVIRDYLDGFIKIAEESGYFKNKQIDGIKEELVLINNEKIRTKDECAKRINELNSKEQELQSALHDLVEEQHVKDIIASKRRELDEYDRELKAKHSVL